MAAKVARIQEAQSEELKMTKRLLRTSRLKVPRSLDGLRNLKFLRTYKLHIMESTV